MSESDASAAIRAATAAYRASLEERRIFLAAVDAIPSDRVLKIEVTKGEVALLIRSQASLFDALEDVVESLRETFGSLGRHASVPHEIRRARADFDTATNAILQKIVDQENG